LTKWPCGIFLFSAALQKKKKKKKKSIYKENIPEKALISVLPKAKQLYLSKGVSDNDGLPC